MKKSNLVILLVSVILFSSCYSVKKMNTQVVKGYLTYPEEFIQTVSELLPVKETTIRSVDTIYKEGLLRIDSVFLTADCDTIKPNSEGKKIVYLPGTTKTRVDSFFVHTRDSIVVKDNKETIAITNKFNNQSKELAAEKNTNKILGWTLAGILFLIIVYLVIKKFTKWLL